MSRQFDSTSPGQSDSICLDSLTARHLDSLTAYCLDSETACLDRLTARHLDSLKKILSRQFDSMYKQSDSLLLSRQFYSISRKSESILSRRFDSMSRQFIARQWTV